MTENKPLMSLAELYLRELIAEARSDNNKTAQGGVYAENTPDGESAIEPLPSVDFRDRIKLFETVTRFLAIKHRIRPDEEEPDGIEHIRQQLSGASSGRGSDAAPAPSPPATSAVTPFTPRRN